MGVVRKQSILSLISIYAGFAIGALNTYLFNLYLTQEEYGLTGVFREVFIVFSAFASFGTFLTFYRFAPLYNHYLSREKNDLPFLIVGICVIGLSVTIALLFGFKGLVIQKFSTNAPSFVEKFYLVVPLIITFLCVNLFEVFAYMLKRTASFNLVKEVGFRLFQTIIILIYVKGWIDISTFFILFSLMYIPSVIIMSWIVFSNNGIKVNIGISNLTKRIYKMMAGYTFFHFSSTLLVYLPTALNSFLITSISKNGLSDTAVYVLARFFISVIDAPLRSMVGINVATLSEAFHQKDFAKIARIYKKTSISLLVIGIVIFALIYSNIDLLTHLFKDKDYSQLANLFAIFGIAKLFELSMGMNNTILYLSKYWKTDFYTSNIIILLSLPINYFLVKQSPLLGAAIGEATMLIVYCLARLFWVQKLLHIQPYTIKTAGTFVIGIISLTVTLLIPKFSNIFLDICVRSSVFLVIYLPLIWWYKPSQDIHELMEKVKSKIWRA